MLIGIAGKAGAGKDTAAKILQDIISSTRGENPNWFYPIVHVASPIKKMLNAGFNWKDINWEDREWKEKIIPGLGFSPRQAAQKLGTEWRDMMDPTKLMWCHLAEGPLLIGEFMSGIVPDMRFPHEQDWIHSHGGKVIYIERTGIDEVHPHISENSIDMDKVDLVIYNRYDINYLHAILAEAVKEGFFK